MTRQVRGPETGAQIALLESCRRGDRNALDQVLREQSPYIERVLARLVGPGADLDDLLQQTFIAVVAAFPQFRGEASVRTWMCRIAVNMVRQHLRRPERKRRVALELVADPADSAPAADDRAMGRRRLERLFHHLDAIGDKNRIAFILHVFEGHPLDEVAALTGASKAATKSRVFLARRALLARARKDPALNDLFEELHERGGES